VPAAVTFDFWGTLLFDGPASDDINYQRPRLTAFANILAAAGIPTTSADLDRAYEESGHALGRLWRTCRDISVNEHVATLLQALDPALPARLDERVTAALVEVYARAALTAPPTPDHEAKPVLESLAREGVTLAVISNTMRTPGQVLRELLDGYGLLQAFAVLTFSDECRIRKPNPEIFHLTLKQIGVVPSEAIHVGDDPHLDVQGAKAAGMRAVHLTTSRPRGRYVRADAVVTRLRDLPAALSAL
jgi:putative hydrolase of the HAD superfamily